MLLNKIKGITSVFIISFIFALIAFQIKEPMKDQITSSAETRYIIDAGHGVPDGGTVGKDGTTEQELNLAIALKVSSHLSQMGIGHQMTRTDENSIFTEGDTIHTKKVSDIRRRIAIAEENPKATLISIHMNSYPDKSVRGIQVFYSASDDVAKDLAQKIQDEFNQQLQPQNTKVIKTIPKNIYLFSHIENPSVLIECGFLSNDQELEHLKNEEYQNQITQIIADTLKNHQK